MKSLNFSNVAKREPLAEGLYVLRIEEATECVSSTGKDMLKVKFIEEESNTALFENYVLTEAALWKLADLLDALGYDTSADMELDFTELAGASIKAKVVQDEYNGSTVNRVKKVFAC